MTPVPTTVRVRGRVPADEPGRQERRQAPAQPQHAVFNGALERRLELGIVLRPGIALTRRPLDVDLATCVAAEVVRAVGAVANARAGPAPGGVARLGL